MPSGFHVVRFLDTAVEIEVPEIGPTLIEHEGEWVATAPAFETILRAWREGATDREPRGWITCYGGEWDDFIVADLDPEHADGIRQTVVEYDTVHDRRNIPSTAVVFHLDALPFEVEVAPPSDN